jgi:AbrB family looped-hinge helix DNA binding protein
MLRHRSTVARKGQVTIPKQYRDEFGISEGDKVEWSREDGKLVLRRADSIVDRTFGALSQYAAAKNRGKSIGQILAEEEAAIEAAWSERHERWERGH